MNTLEGNKLIAEFMGGEYDANHSPSYPCFHKLHNGGTWDLDELKYHTSWDWLMPVVEKINVLDNREYDVIIWRSDCHINNREEILFESSILKRKDTLILVVWGCIVQFLKWYNQNKPQ